MKMPGIGNLGDMSEEDITKFLTRTMDDLFKKLISKSDETRGLYLKNPFKSKKKHKHLMSLFKKQKKESVAFSESILDAIGQSKSFSDPKEVLAPLEILSSRAALIEKIIEAKMIDDKERLIKKEKKLAKKEKKLAKKEKKVKKVKKG